jgi:hypothetical protein
MSHKGKFKVHGPPTHRKAPEHQVRPPDLLPPELDRRYWYIPARPVSIPSAIPFLFFILFVISLAIFASGEVDWHFCLPGVIILIVVAIVAHLLGRKR